MRDSVRFNHATHQRPDLPLAACELFAKNSSLTRLDLRGNCLSEVDALCKNFTITDIVLPERANYVHQRAVYNHVGECYKREEKRLKCVPVVFSEWPYLNIAV